MSVGAVVSGTVSEGLRLLAAGAGAGIKSLLPDVPDMDVPPVGRIIELPGRGSTYVVDIPGPHPDAPTVVLLHGLACNAALCWAATLGPLSRMARVVLFDLRWHGRGITSPHFTLEDCADDVDAVLAEMRISEAILAGYSLGGAVAQLTWSRRPTRVSGLVLCSTARNYQGHAGEQFFFPVMNTLARSLRPVAHAAVERRAASLEEIGALQHEDVTTWARAELRSTSLWSISQAMNAIGQFNSAPWISGVDVPTAVVATVGDKAIPTRRQRRLAESIPGASLYEAPGGHAALFLSADTWTPVFLDAVSEIAQRARRSIAV